MRDVLSIKHVYIVQEEDTATSHFHVWLFPRYPWMEKEFGLKIESVKPIMKYAENNMKNADNLSEIENATQKLRQSFLV